MAQALVLKVDSSLGVGLASNVVLADQLTKLLVTRWVRQGGSVDLLGGSFRLCHAHNSSGALEMFDGLDGRARGLMLLVPVALIFSLMLILQKYAHNRPVLNIAATLVIGGALGNLTDRLIREFVVDIFQIQWLGFHSAVFNLADISIFLGMGLVFGMAVRRSFALRPSE